MSLHAILLRLCRTAAGVFCAGAVLCAASHAHAEAARTVRPRHGVRAHSVKAQEPQGDTHAKPKAGAKSGTSSKTPPAHPQNHLQGHAPSHSKTDPQSATKPHRATPKARRPPHLRDDDNPDPATMVRVRKSPARPPAAKPQTPAPRMTTERAAALQSAQLAESIEESVREQARSQARAAAPAVVVASAQPPAPIARVPAAARVPASARRIDGFGAEGASLPAARTATSTEPLPAEVPMDSDREAHPDLEMLAHPSRSELAEEAVQPRLYGANGRLMLPAPLTGSHDVLVHQNQMADDEGLSRIRNDAELNRLRAAHLLVDFPVSASLRLNPELPANRRCARPWTVRFAADAARAFYARFHQPLQVNSAVRSVAYQLRLQHTNGNAAAVEGETASPHLTGQAIDFAKRGMTVEQLAWMRAYLLPLRDAGKIDVEEEFQQACFHISVYRSYMPPAHTVPRTDVAQLHRGTRG
jgi:hypothetical protein